MERELTETKEQRAEALNSLSTLCDFFQNRVLKGPSDEALREFNRATKEWVSVTYKELGEKVKNWQRAFADLGLNRGDRVAMLLPNGVNAVCFDQAAMANSLVPVPLHAIDTPASSAFILQDCGASVLVTDKKSKWEKIQEAGFDLSAIKKVIITEELTEATGLTQGVKEWLMGAPKDILLPEQPKVDDLACIVYTSGTTGKPKGVMLTHKNITSNVRSTLAHVKPEIGDIFLSFLPLSHMFERTAGYYLALATGSTIVFNRSLQYLAEDFKIAKPNVLISVPRVYERIYAKLNDALTDYDPDDIDAGALSLWRDGDDIYAVPFSTSPFIMIYNKDLFEQAGLKDPNEYVAEGTWTWETFRECMNRRVRLHDRQQRGLCRPYRDEPHSVRARLRRRLLDG